LQWRLLQTVVEVAAEKNSTLVMPFPVELLRFFDRAGPAGSVSMAATDTDTADAPAVPAPAAPAVADAPAVPAALPAPVPAAQSASPQAVPLNGARKADPTG
jgi:hypothetical protein